MPIFYFFIVLLSCLLGLAAGSFINVIVFRYNPDKEDKIIGLASGRSHCRSCDRTLTAWELVPVFSFVFLKGRCHSCKNKISWQYPLVEIITSVIFGFLSWKILSADFFVYYISSGSANYLWLPVVILLWFFYSSVLITLSFIDIRHYILPDRIIFPAAITSFLANIGFYFLSKDPLSGFPQKGLNFLGPISDIFFVGNNILINHILAAVVLSGFLFIIYWITRGKGIGLGDVKMVGLIGLMMGFIGGIMSVFFAFIIGFVIAIFLLIFNLKKFKDKIPFGPVLALGVFVVIFFGERILNGYFGLF